jgi:hypothetical protein
METAKGMTKRITLTKYDKTEDISDQDVEQIIGLLPTNKKPIDNFRINARVAVLVMPDENTRNSTLITLKKSLRSQ